jgi:putative addiction module killer protein
LSTTSRTVIVYHDPKGKEPFTDWLNRLGDASTRRRILQRLFRLESGYFGDCKPVGGGVSELRFFFGPGYRVYFGVDGDTIVVILCGGDKGKPAPRCSTGTHLLEGVFKR